MMKQFQIYIDTGLHKRVITDGATGVQNEMVVQNEVNSDWWEKFRAAAKLLGVEPREMIGDGHAGVWIRESPDAVTGWSLAELIHAGSRLVWIGAIAGCISATVGVVGVALGLVAIFTR